jgi:hypothetical protein
MARLSIEYEHAGRPIAGGFIGLSYESAVVAANDFFTADNRTLLRLLRTLGSEGVLRIGGNTSDARCGGRRMPRRRARISSSRRRNQSPRRFSARARLAAHLRAQSGDRHGRGGIAEAAYVARAVGPRP